MTNDRRQEGWRAEFNTYSDDDGDLTTDSYLRTPESGQYWIDCCEPEIVGRIVAELNENAAVMAENAELLSRQAKLVEALREVREVVEEFNYYKAYDIIDAALSLVPNQGTKP